MLIQVAFSAFSCPPAPQGSLRIIPQFSNWDASPLSSFLLLSQTQTCGPQRPSSCLPCFPHPIHVHLSSGLRSSATPSHMGSSTNCSLCVENTSVPTGHSTGPGTQRMLGICRLAAEYQTQGSARPIPAGHTLFLSQPFQFLSLSTAFTQHAFNSSQVAGGERHTEVLKQWVRAMMEINTGCRGSSDERRLDQQGLPWGWRHRMRLGGWVGIS